MNGLGIIVVVGSENDTFHFMGENKTPFYTENSKESFFYNEMCGHRFMLENFERFKDKAYIGLEHYRRAFDYTDGFIHELLAFYDIIVKKEHGPFGMDTNLTVLSHCSRHGLNYMNHAKEWISKFPELEEQANLRTHYGCNMFIARPDKYKEMIEDEFRYIDEMMKTPNLQQSEVSYFCETILTPYMIKKHNKNIAIGRTKICL